MSVPGPREYGRNILYLKWPYFQAIASHETRLCSVCAWRHATRNRRQGDGRMGPGTMPFEGSICPRIYISNAGDSEAFHPNLQFFPPPLLRKPFVVLMWQRPVPRESMPPFPELSIQTDVGDLRAASIHEQLELAISCSPSFPPCFPPSMPLFFLLFIYHI